MSAAVRVLSAAWRRPPLLQRAWLMLRLVVLYWNADSDECYMRLCQAEGIMGTQTLEAWRQHLQACRCEIAVLEAQLRGEARP